MSMLIDSGIRSQELGDGELAEDRAEVCGILVGKSEGSYVTQPPGIANA